MFPHYVNGGNAEIVWTKEMKTRKKTWGKSTCLLIPGLSIVDFTFRKEEEIDCQECCKSRRKKKRRIEMKKKRTQKNGEKIVVQEREKECCVGNRKRMKKEELEWRRKEWKNVWMEEKSSEKIEPIRKYAHIVMNEW